MYSQSLFLEALSFIVRKVGYTVNEDFCFCPDLTDPDPVCHFEGVMFGQFEDEVTTTDEQCKMYIEEACKLYLEKHPNQKMLINGILDSGKF